MPNRSPEKEYRRFFSSLQTVCDAVYRNPEEVRRGKCTGIQQQSANSSPLFETARRRSSKRSMAQTFLRTMRTPRARKRIPQNDSEQRKDVSPTMLSRTRFPEQCVATFSAPNQSPKSSPHGYLFFFGLMRNPNTIRRVSEPHASKAPGSARGRFNLPQHDADICPSRARADILHTQHTNALLG